MLSQSQFYKDLTRKTDFFEGWSWFKSNNLGLALGSEISHQCGKRVKTKSQKVFAANSYICRSYRGKTGRGRGGSFCPLPPLFIPFSIELRMHIRACITRLEKVL